jgi:HEAT repeat protein
MIRALAASGSDISIGDLLVKLQSPRFTVRLEALSSLHALPPDKREVQPLIAEVKNRIFTTAYIAAEILGRKGYTEGVDILRKRLHSDDYYLSGKCMVALAYLGDRQSISPIRDILRKTANPRLIIHAASALEIFRDVEAIPDILRKLQHKTSPFLRDEIILSLSGTMGMDSWFYPHYLRFLESATRGILSLEDELRAAGGSVAQVRSMLRLLPRRDRAAFSEQAASLLRVGTVEMNGRDVSGWLAEALHDEKLVKLDRFCFLIAAVIVSAYGRSGNR